MDNNQQRVDEFKEEITNLDLRPPEDSRERLWLIVGLILVIAGVIVVFVGYYGASGTSNVGKQMPYLLSGGFMGLALTIAGAALFVRYSLTRYLRFWLLRSIYEDRAQTDRTVEALGRVEAVLRTATKPRTTADK